MLYSRLFVLASGLAAVSAQGIRDQKCSEEGFPIGVEKYGVSVDFINSKVTCNNLDGVGPQTGCPEEIRYSNMGFDYGLSPGPEDDTSVDLVVTFQEGADAYAYNDIERNGLTRLQAGEFGQINLADNRRCKFKYSFYVSGTYVPVTFSTAFYAIFLDMDFGDNGRLVESVEIVGADYMTTVEEACRDLNQPTPCLASTVILGTNGGNFLATAGARGYGEDNPESLDQILRPVADMDDFQKIAASRYVNATFLPPTSSFELYYAITPAELIDTSGRNFQFAMVGSGGERPVFAPCFYCDKAVPGSQTCKACGTEVAGLAGGAIACPETGSWAPECSDAEARECIPGSPTYPACMETCASDCESKGECSKYTCYSYKCQKCGEGDCAAGTECYAMGCGEGEGFKTLEACNKEGGMDGGNCPQYVCVPENQQCYACDSDFIKSLGPNYCAGKTLYAANGFNCRIACNPPVARKDPHLYLPHGGRADFRGANNETFAMLSAKDVAFNVKIEEADFNWAKRLVHGTKMSAAYWILRTTSGKVLKIEFNASKVAVVHEDGHRDVEMKEGMPALVVDNVQVTLESQKLSVLVAGKWLMTAAVAAFPFGNLAANKNKKLLDISIEALYDADHDVIAPHGIFGQAYDGDDIGVSGKLDEAKDGESTTTAQAEGAIEGIWVDYKLASPFATDFKYSRFDATSAKTRDVSQLTGAKTKKWASKVQVGASDLPEFQ